ncbi:glutathione-specific gamma-glutamylcyclotransferase 1-like [Babylonia areolata]|uniref:glutathione-specific gamma-glutamylcyclotransferase 1-like n=1 Tax=Babylonia areolata TaxID=304850 RepID=UPI003FCF730A
MKDAMINMMQEENTIIRVFAYGSLLWKPSFHYNRRVVGHIKGFKRRFFQGNTNFRGSVSQPGRVAILVPDEQEVTWGMAYEIRGRQHVQDALEHLYVRENTSGGYQTMINTFHPRPALPHHLHHDSDVTVMSEPFSVISFTATPTSHLYMGSADVGTMAQQVVAARGEAGTNAEYVLRTAEFIREHIPEDDDHHLFGLEKKIRELLSAGAAHHHQHHRNSVHCETVSSVTPTLHTVTVPA